MLEGLDAIDWAHLEHAYGSADDVPDMIRALASPDRETRQQALHAAYGNIHHQGTRYTATPHAIRFLIELVADARTPARDELLGLLTHCVAGYFSPTFGPVTASGAVWGRRVAPMSDYGETAEVLADCERAAEPGVPVAVALLGHASAAMRMRAAQFLAALWRSAAAHDVVAGLQARLAGEADPRVRAMIVFALGHVVPVGDEALHRVFAGDDVPLARLMAAIGSVRRGDASPQMASALVGWLRDAALAEAFAELPFPERDLGGTLGALLPELGAAALTEAMPALLERLRTGSDFGLVGVLAAALAATFGDQPRDPACPLTDPQRELLTTLVGNQGFWMIGNAFELLHARGLPSGRDAMAELLGVVVMEDPREQARLGARMFAGFGPARALEAWRDVLARYPDDVEALATAGLYLLELDAYDEALALFEQAIAHGPSGGEHYGSALFGRGNVLFATGELEAADRSFAAARLHLTGQRQELARHNRVAILQRLGRADEALALVAEAPGRDVEDWYHLGLAQVKAGKYRDCIDSITRVLAADPDHALAHYTIACAHALLGEVEPALAAIARAIECDPDLVEGIAEDQDFAALRDEPRFVALIGG